jgi:hypothetical protein
LITISGARCIALKLNQQHYTYNTWHKGGFYCIIFKYFFEEKKSALKLIKPTILHWRHDEHIEIKNIIITFLNFMRDKQGKKRRYYSGSRLMWSLYYYTYNTWHKGDFSCHSLSRWTETRGCRHRWKSRLCFFAHFCNDFWRRYNFAGNRCL